LPERPTPERCVEAYYLQKTRFESIAERKLRRRQLTEAGNVEISGRDLGECQVRAVPIARERLNSTLSGPTWALMVAAACALIPVIAQINTPDFSQWV
jgi:hypothetical protein